MSELLPLTPEDVAAIVAILDGSNYDRLELNTGRFTLRVVRDGAGWTQEWDWSLSAASAGLERAANPAVVEAGEAEHDGRPLIRSPLPGIFYRAPQPGAPPFVDVGDRVAPDTVIGIIETMKLMNPVHAGMTGVVEAILAENGTMVANGEGLIVVAEDAV